MTDMDGPREIGKLRAEIDQHTKHAKAIAIYLMSQHYPENQSWAPEPTLGRLLCQIDNIMQGLERKQERAPDLDRRTKYYSGAWLMKAPGHRASFSDGPFYTAEEQRCSQQKWLFENGYTKPRFWQWWRWDEPRYEWGS